MASGGIWREARDVALRLRERLLGDDAENAVPVERLIRSALKAAGLRCQPRKPTDPLLSGAHAVLDNEVRAVWVRADSSSADRQVYIAHELAHLHLHHTDHDESGLCHCDAPDFSDADMFLRTGYGPRQRRETEANVFAREFLLPAPIARRLFQSGMDARTIASRVGIPVSLVFAQLQEGVSREWGVGGREEAEGEGSGAVSSPPPTPHSPLPTPYSLDESQSVAATAPTGPLLVVAGPGTGKTRTLVARVLYLVNEVGVAPESLLLVTFTRKTVEEMRERIAAVDPEMARRIAVHTYHSYGLDLLRRHPKAAGLPPTPVLLEKADAVLLLERRAATLDLDALRYLHDPAYPLPDVFDSITRAKDDMLTPEDYAARAAETGDPRLEDAGKIFATYEAVLREYGALDYSDLVVRAVRLLEENADVRKAEQDQWQHILVDEYQDINRSGARLIKALAGEGAGLWVVGDVRQAIYAWRGATPECVSQFERDYPAGQRANLAVNYRSRRELVRFFGVASTEGPDTWRAARDNPDEPPATLTLAIAPSEAAQADGLAEKMASFYGMGYRWQDMAVLCRTHRQAKAVRLCLAEREIPVARPPAENGPLSSPDARNLVSALSLAVDPTGPAHHRFPELPTGLPFRGDALEFWNELLWGPPGWARNVEDFESVAYLLGLARSFKERAGVLLGPKDDPRREFLRHLRRIAAGGGSADPNEDAETDAIRVMTVHQAKGLEFPIVFVPNLSVGMFPSRPRPQLIPPLQNVDDDGGSEERRLFFVALTRARDHLVLSRSRGIYSNNRRAEPSPLLQSVEDAPGLRPEEWRFSPPNVPREPADIPPPPTGPKPTVSADDAGLYLRCPRRYYYERIEGLQPGEPTPYVGFRRSVREALAGDDPVAELDYAWDRHGPEETHPFTPFYREAAEEIVAREAGKGKRLRGETSSDVRRMDRAPGVPTRRGPRPDLPVLSLELPNGTVTLQPDAVDNLANEYEYQTFRKPPEIGASEAELRDESAAYLLQEAARRASPNAPATVHVRFMQNGLSLPLADKQNERVKHIRDYDRALRGLRLKVYNPEPRDPGRDCPECPYYFICPE